MKRFIASALLTSLICSSAAAQDFKLNSKEYFTSGGVDVMAFNDFYPEGHQGGISVLMNGHRIASNGDIRFEQTPGQWQQVEYCLGGDSTHYMFLVLAAKDILQ